MKFFDSHSHPQFLAYDQDREEMIRRSILEAGVLTVAVGTMFETSKNAVELAKKYPENIWTAVGIHPYHVTKNLRDSMETEKEFEKQELDSRFEKLAAEPEVVAIGESGLDFYYLEKNPAESHAEIIKKQKENFLAHIELARKVQKPLIIHGRKAYTEIYEILRKQKFPHGGAMHFFQGSGDKAKKFMDLGFYISFAGPITFTDMYDEVIKYVPLERLLIETDAPYATPAPFRGRRNEPAYVRYVAEKVAALKNLSTEKVAEATMENAAKLFKLNLHPTQ